MRRIHRLTAAYRRTYRTVRHLGGGLRSIPGVKKIYQIREHDVPEDMKRITLTFRDINCLNTEVADFKQGKDKNLDKLVKRLVSDADKALSRQLYSVVDKTKLPPSGDPHDYWSTAPYWWPDPNTETGLPYIRRDGEWEPSALVSSPESEQYDRARIRRLFVDSMILSLAWKFTDDEKYIRRGADMLKCFFINPATRMNPNLRFAQVHLGHDNNEGSPYGIIDGEGIYYYLDAVRIIIEAGVLDSKTLCAFTRWLRKYLRWLLESKQGIIEQKTLNNHGTLYDLQVAAMAEFTGNTAVLYDAIHRAQSRVAHHFALDGSQPEELARTNSAHYCCANYQAWVHLSSIAHKWGINLWAYEHKGVISLRRGAEWILSTSLQKWPHQNINYFQQDRFAVIRWTIPQDIVPEAASKKYAKSKYGYEPMFGPGYDADPNPNNSVQPYWNLGISSTSGNSDSIK